MTNIISSELKIVYMLGLVFAVSGVITCGETTTREKCSHDECTIFWEKERERNRAIIYKL